MKREIYDMLKCNYGNDLKAEATRLRLTQEELSRQTGVSQTTISKIFNSSIDVSADSILIIAKRLGVNVWNT